MNALLRATLASAAVLAWQYAAGEGANLFAPSWSVGKRIDAERALPPTPFYRAPAGGSPGVPGLLIRSASANDFDLPPGVSATRILYRTQTAAGEDATASGVVLVPYGTPPTGGWPLVAWSHGTSGVDRSCAPSLMRSLFYDWEGLYEYVLMGFAVVATDYAGLGSEGRHAYIDMLSNGADVLNSVAAAHAAVATLSSRWVVVGHSQGGLSSLGAAQLEATRNDPGYLGAVVLAGASDLEDVINSTLQAREPVLNGLLAFGVYGFQTLYPRLAAEKVLTARALAQYDMFVTDGCSAASGAFATVPPGEMFRAEWKSDPYVKKFLARNQPGTQPVRGPLLIVTGGDDVLFTPNASRIVAARLCNAGVRTQRSLYPGLGHDPLVYGSIGEQLKWISGRFSGETAPSNCD